MDMWPTLAAPLSCSKASPLLESTSAAAAAAAGLLALVDSFTISSVDLSSHHGVNIKLPCAKARVRVSGDWRIPDVR